MPPKFQSTPGPMGPEQFQPPMGSEQVRPVTFEERVAAVADVLPKEHRAEFDRLIGYVPAARENLHKLVARDAREIHRWGRSGVEDDVQRYRGNAGAKEISGGLLVPRYEVPGLENQHERRTVVERVASKYGVQRWVEPAPPSTGSPNLDMLMGALLSRPLGGHQPNPVYGRIEASAEGFFAQRFSPRRRDEITREGESRLRRAIAPDKDVEELPPDVLEKTADMADENLEGELVVALDSLYADATRPIRRRLGRIAARGATGSWHGVAGPSQYETKMQRSSAISQSLRDLSRIVNRDGIGGPQAIRKRVEVLLANEGYLPKLDRIERSELVERYAKKVRDMLDPGRAIDDAVKHVETQLRDELNPPQRARSQHSGRSGQERQPTDSVAAEVRAEIAHLRAGKEDDTTILRKLVKKYGAGLTSGDPDAQERIRHITAILRPKPTTRTRSGPPS